MTSQYSNAVTATINDVDCGNIATRVTRIFTVPAGTIVGDVNLGIFLDHSYRSDLRITLASPAGTTINVMLNTGGTGDNLNDLFDDEAAVAISAHNGTATDPLMPVPPPYSHSFIPSAALSAFDGQNAAGNWTLVVCDSVGQDAGTFRRADLYITSAQVNVSKTSKVIDDGISGANPKSIPGATIEYCLLMTNASPIATTNLTPSDILPANVTLIPGSLRSGTSCTAATTIEDADATGADESDPFGMAITGSTITGSAPSLAAGGSFAMLFRATVN